MAEPWFKFIIHFNALKIQNIDICVIMDKHNCILHLLVFFSNKLSCDDDNLLTLSLDVSNSSRKFLPQKEQVFDDILHWFFWQWICVYTTFCFQTIEGVYSLFVRKKDHLREYFYCIPMIPNIEIFEASLTSHLPFSFLI